jgi:hypothetical protein
MILRSKKRRGPTLDELYAQIEALSAENRRARDPELAGRVLELRHRAGLDLLDGDGEAAAAHPEPAFDRLPEGPLPEVAPQELTPELLRAAMLRSGCLLVRGLAEQDDVGRLVDGIDRAYEAREAAGSANGRYFEEFEPEPPYDIRFDRGVIRGGAALLAADSPRVMFDVLDCFERAGLRELAGDYLGERPAISVNKFLLRKVTPQVFDASTRAEGRKPSAWHQDGAFLGDVQALNVWLSLSRCGDVAPGMDIVPRRLERIVPTGTEGAVFDWSASQAVAEEAAGDVGILRPIFDPGDALLFDELFLHSTAAEPEMQNMRYAVESWFFGPSRFPAKYAPLAF